VSRWVCLRCGDPTGDVPHACNDAGIRLEEYRANHTFRILARVGVWVAMEAEVQTVVDTSTDVYGPPGVASRVDRSSDTRTVRIRYCIAACRVTQGKGPLKLTWSQP